MTRDFKITVVERLQREPELAEAMLDEAINLLQEGEPEAARLMLRTLVNATVGFEALAAKIQGDSKSLHRMLSAKGNPGMNNLSSILSTLREAVRVKPQRRRNQRASA